MAKAQQRISAITIWMIVFVGLWLASTVILVILYTEHEDLKNLARQRLTQKQTAVSATEEREIELIRAPSASGPTMVGILNEERQLTAQYATGDPENSASVVRERRDALIKRIATDQLVADHAAYAGQPLLGMAEKLYEEYRSATDALTEARNSVKQLTDQLDQNVAAKTAQATEFDKKAQELTEQSVKSEQGRTETDKEYAASLAQIKGETDRKLEAIDDILAKERAEKAELVKNLDTIKERLAVLDEQVGPLRIGPKPLTTARLADGTVLQAVPGDKMVYIDLGKDDRLVLGMQFAVYSYETGIPPDGRGKGRIEVVSIYEDSAECKIVETFRNQVIFPNDLVANPVYDRNRAPTFLVIGEFDLNHDGATDPDGVGTVESLVSAWGGTIVDDLTARTDFVVLGASPSQPPPIGQVSPEEAQRLEAARRAFDRYTEAVAKAKDLAVPVLTQNVFLHFLGYSGRGGLRSDR